MAVAATVLLLTSTTVVAAEAHLLVATALVAATANVVGPLLAKNTMAVGADTNLLLFEGCEDLHLTSMDLAGLTAKIPTAVPRPATKTRMLLATSVRRGLEVLQGAMVATMSLAAIGR